MFKFYINNFRSFKEQYFNFSRINILIGENNSGKSSILKFFLALKQSISFSAKSNFCLIEDFVDLGYYEDIIYNHIIDEKITFEFDFNKKYKDFFDSFMFPSNIDNNDIETKNKYSLIKKMINEIEDHNVNLRITFGKKLNSHLEIQTEIKSKVLGSLTFQAITEDNINPIDPSITPKGKMIYHNVNDNIHFESDLIEYEKKSFFSLIVGKSLKNELDKKNYSNEIYYKIAYLLVSQNYLEVLASRFSFFNPIDSKPERFYMRKEKNLSLKKDLTEFVNLLSDPDISETLYSKIFSSFSSLLQDFGLAEQIFLLKDNKLPVSELKVKIKNTISNITDVGYGVAIQVPLLFDLLLNQEYEKIYLIEQPEVHLFPKLQANFIDVLLKYSNNSNIFFIETHSEHILRKLQVLVKEKKYGLKPEDVSIHYLTRGDNKSIITEHKIDEKGKLNPIFPKGFFDTSYKLVKELFD